MRREGFEVVKTSYRYITNKRRNEKSENIYVKEMIEVFKNEEVKENLYVKGIKLSKHALERVEHFLGISNQATATKKIKDMLKQAQRIGTVLSFDGRVNVLYAFDKTAIYLSPDLKTVVTVNKYRQGMLEPFSTKVKELKLNKEQALDLHWEELNKVIKKESEYIEKVLEIEAKVRESNEMLSTLLDLTKGRRRQIKKLISEQNLLLKQEGWKLFNLMIKKRHICKSLVSLY